MASDLDLSPGSRTCKLTLNKISVVTGCAGVFMLLGMLYALLTPLFEAPDEPAHFRYVRLVREQANLPRLDLSQPFAYESLQPPLYYVLLALTYNPLSVPEGWPAAPYFQSPTLNKFLHNSPEDAKWIGLFRLRRYQLLFGSITVIVTFFLAYKILGHMTPSAFASWYVATLPQFTFISSAINNDNLANAVSSLLLLMACGMFTRNSISRSYAITAGVLAGLGLITKLSSAVSLAVLAAATLAVRLPFRERVTLLAWIVVIASIIAAPYFIWFYSVHGVFIGRLPNQVPMVSDLRQISMFFEYLWKSYVGKFGWMTYEAPGVVYWFHVFILLAALFGLIRGWSSTDRRIQLCGVAIIMAVALVGFYCLRVDFNPQARYMFVSLPAIAVLISFGLECLISALSSTGSAPGGVLGKDSQLVDYYSIWGTLFVATVVMNLYALVGWTDARAWFAYN